MPFDDPTELFYLVDKTDKVLGSVARNVAHSDRTKIHRAVDILVINQNQLLLQKRSVHKDTNPGLWTISASGHVTFGQSYEYAAKRELKEELGIKSKLRFIGKLLFDSGIEQEFSSVYETEYNETPTHYDKSEVEKVMWVNLEDLPTFISQNKVTASAIQVLSFAGYIK